jgi:hypothetical protein
LSALRDRIGTPAVRTRIFDAEREQPDGAVDYSILMAPELVGYAIRAAAPGGIINMFASPPAEAMVSLDLDAIAAKRLYLLGTSGSTVDDMQAVLRKAEAGEINPDISVGAVAGLAGAIAGYQAVRDRRIAGKVIVYPELVDCPLTTLAELAEAYPSMAPMLAESVWSAAAERELATCFQKAVTAAAPATVRTSSTTANRRDAGNGRDCPSPPSAARPRRRRRRWPRRSVRAHRRRFGSRSRRPGRPRIDG